MGKKSKNKTKTNKQKPSTSAGAGAGDGNNFHPDPMAQRILRDAASLMSPGRRLDPKVNIYDNRKIYFGESSQKYLLMRDVIQYLLEQRKAKAKGTVATATAAAEDDKSHNRAPKIALDIGSGPGVFVLAYARDFPTLQWYPSEIDNKGDSNAAFRAELLATLDFLRSDAEPQFTDESGIMVHIGDSVLLNNISSPEYNHQEGILKGKDPENPGRFGVCLGPSQFKGKVISVLAEKILYHGNTMGDPDHQKGLSRTQQQTLSETNSNSTSNSNKSLLEGLRNRAFALDLLTPPWTRELFDNEIQQSCSIITCTHLLTMIGYKAPHATQLCLGLAHDALEDGGYLITMDSVQHDGGNYGNEVAMRKYLMESGVGLSLVDVPTDIAQRMRQVDDRMKIMIYRRDHSIRGGNPGW